MAPSVCALECVAALIYFTYQLLSPNMPFSFFSLFTFIMYYSKLMPYLAHKFCIEAVTCPYIATSMCCIVSCVVLKKLKLKCKGTLSKSSQSFPRKAQNGSKWLFFLSVPEKKWCVFFTFGCDYNLSMSMGRSQSGLELGVWKIQRQNTLPFEISVWDLIVWSW